MSTKKSVLNLSTEELGTNSSSSSGAGQKATDRDTIRVVIRDAKPPLVARALQFLMRVICFVLLIAVCAIGIPRLFGIYEYNVLTGSMTPTYPVGTLVFVQSKDPYSIRPGEVTTYVADENLNLITHRCVSNNYDDKTITTRGDANNSDDAPVLYENVVGVVVFSVPYIGEAVDYITNDDVGRVVGIGILIGILALTFLAEGICSMLTKQNAKFANGNSKSKRKGKHNKDAVIGTTAVSVGNIEGQMTFEDISSKSTAQAESDSFKPNWDASDTVSDVKDNCESSSRES